jgi:cell division control protein 45
MYLPRALIAKLYLHLQNTRHPLSPPVLVLVALEPDALCACRILTRLFKHDYIPHKIQPVAGYADLERVGRELVVPMTEAAGGAGGVVVCLGVGGMADLGTVLGLEQEEGADGGAGAGEGAQAFGKVEVWVVDSHRPWNLSNVFGGFPLEPETEEARTFAARAPVGVKDGCIERAYRPGKGGIVVFDDGDIEEGLAKEREAYLALVDMPDVEDDGEDLGDSSDDDDDDQDDDESDHDEGKRAVKSARAGQKRKSWDFLDEDSEEDDDRPRQRRRSNSVRASLSPHFPEFSLTKHSPLRSQTPPGGRHSGVSFPCGTILSSRVTVWNPRLPPSRRGHRQQGRSGGGCFDYGASTRAYSETTTGSARRTRSQSHP